VQFITDWEKEARGYVLEVDLFIPEELHDMLDDLPLAPEKAHPNSAEFTSFMRQQWDALSGNKSYRPTEKLLLTHSPKERYIIHFSLLLYYVKLGARVTCVHRSTLFKSYITFNSEKRAGSNNPFEKYKLKNNSLYGKTVEDVRKRRDIRLCNSEQKLTRYTSKATFYGARRFAENIVGVHMLRQSVLLDKPVAIGQAVLDISKLEMYELRYHHLAHYAALLNGSIVVAGGDTDSFFLKVSVCVCVCV